MLTCKRFLQELSDYLEGRLDPETQAELQKHLNDCPNCWVVCDTTKKTIKVFKGMQAQILPSGVQMRLSEYLARHMKAKCEKSSTAVEPDSLK